MARMPRNCLPPHGTFHVTNRGVEQRPIYLDDQDRRLFVALLERAARRFRWQLSAYVLMQNHFHLVVTSELVRLSRGMHHLSFRHAQHFNETHERAGHLFQSRFKARVIEDEEYHSAACAYVFENPGRVGASALPRDYPWSGGAL